MNQLVPSSFFTRVETVMVKFRGTGSHKVHSVSRYRTRRRKINPDRGLRLSLLEVKGNRDKTVPAKETVCKVSRKYRRTIKSSLY